MRLESCRIFYVNALCFSGSGAQKRLGTKQIDFIIRRNFESQFGRSAAGSNSSRSGPNKRPTALETGERSEEPMYMFVGLCEFESSTLTKSLLYAGQNGL